jgi:hypothetical protein
MYRLAFSRTTDGYLKITAVAKDAPTLIAVHLNPEIEGERKLTQKESTRRLIGEASVRVYVETLQRCHTI